MRFFKAVRFHCFETRFSGLNAKQTVTMADYTFNYSLLFINHREINLIVDCPWDLSPQGWFPVPTPGSHGRAVLFLPSSQNPRTSLVWGQTSLLPLVSCKDSMCHWGVWLQRSTVPRASPPLGSASHFPSVLQTWGHAFSFAAWLFCFLSYYQLRKAGKQLKKVD